MAVSNSAITVKIRMSSILNQLIISHASVRKAVKFTISGINQRSNPGSRILKSKLNPLTCLGSSRAGIFTNNRKTSELFACFDQEIGAMKSPFSPGYLMSFEWEKKV